MELLGLNTGYEPIKVLQCTNIQWNRRYYEPGDFAIQLCASEWDTNIAYIYTRDRPETGMVLKVETESNSNGNFVNVSGFFLEGKLNWDVLFPYTWGDSWIAGISVICKTIVSSYFDGMITVVSEPEIGGNVRVRKENMIGRDIGDALYEILKVKEMGQRVTLNIDNGAVEEYRVWKGLDRTQEQSANSFATFGVKIGTVDKIKYTKDISNYKNYIVATYNDGVDDKYVAVDLREISPNEPNGTRKLYYESGLTLAEGQSSTDLFNDVLEAAVTEISKYNRLITIDANVVQSSLIYLTDYDIGDKVDLVVDNLGISYSARIIEVNEVWKSNTHTVDLEFGEKQLTAYNRKRRY